MAIRKTLTSIVLVGALALGVAGCKDDNSQNQPKQNIFQYTQAGQIAELPLGYERGSIDIAAADFDGDGDIDLAVTRVSDNGKVFLYRNDGQGNYSLAGQIAELPRGYERGSIGIAAADFDGDGDIDLATVRNSNEGGGRKVGEGGKVFLYRNDGVDKLIDTKK